MTTRKRDLPPRCYLKHGAFFYVSPDGKWHNLGRDRDEALRRYQAFATRSSNALPATVPALVKYALPIITLGKAKSTVKQYADCAERIATIFAEFRIEDVRPKHIAQVKMSMREHPNMANRVLVVLRLLFGFAVEHQLCEWNPTLGIKPYPEPKRTRLLHDSEIAAIRAAATPRLQSIMDVQRLTGQRISDVLKLRRSDLTDDGVQFVQQKTGSKLLIRWTPELKAAVERALALHRNVKALTVFHGRTGGPPDYRTVLKQWHKAVAKAKVQDARPNDLRAVAITAAHLQGLDPQALAGHSRRKMTERYIREKLGVVAEPPSLSNKVSKIARNS